MGRRGRFVAALLALAFSVVVQAAERPHIQFAEKITVDSGTAQAQFDAYGRRFELNLQSNDRALARLKLKNAKSIAGTRLWRGTLEGQSGSWVRLTERAGAHEGVIWDGHDLYVVTRYENIAASLGTPLAAQTGDTVIFRLSDSSDLLPHGYCGTGPSPDGLASNNGLVQFRNLVKELQVRAMAISDTAARQIEISMIADSAMTAYYTDPIAVMLNSYNIVDGIYVEQVGLLIVPADMRAIPAAGDPFTATNPSTLLGQLTTYRQTTPAVASLGIAHLFTGHDLDGDVAGIARLGGACTSGDAVSLTEGWLGSVSSALVMAHEIGHNFGAEHDGMGACVGVPDSYIMSSTLNGSYQFSQCSLDAISTFIASASCVTPAIYAQVELPQTASVLNGELDVPLVVPFDLHSTGTRAVNDVTLELRINDSFALTATSPGVTCVPVALGLSCDVGQVPAGTVRRVELTFLPSRAGGFTTRAEVSASNNQNTRNSIQNGTINIQNNVDVSVAVATSAPTAEFGDMVDVTLTLRSLRTGTARNVRVGVYGGGLRGESVDAPAGVTCEFNVNSSGQTFCIVGDIPGGETRTIVVHSRASQVVTSLQGTAYVNVDDATSTNNNAYFAMTVTAAHDVGLEVLTTSAPVQYNMPYEYRANLRSPGSQSVDGVRVDITLSMQVPAALDSVSAVTVGGNSCNRLANWHYECIVGTMAAGEVLPLSISGIATGLGSVSVTLNSYATINNNSQNDRVYSGWIVRYGLDAYVTTGSLPVLIEGVENEGSFSAWSNGIQAANDAVLIVELPSQVRFTRFIVRSPGTTSCELVDPQHLRCTYDLPPVSSYQGVTYYLVSDVPGTYQATATLALAGDEDPVNNSLQWPITVNPVLDAGLRMTGELPEYLIVGHDLTVPFEVFTGSRPVAGVSLNVSAQANSALASVSTSHGICSQINETRYTCALGDLDGGSTVSVSAILTATASDGTGVLGVSVTAPGDTNTNNNQRSATFNVVTEGDARVTVGSPTFTATSGTEFDLPAISVWGQGDVANGRLTITVPAGFSVASLTGTGYICSGTVEIVCDLPSWLPENDEYPVSLRLLPSAAGSFVITARVTAENDFTNSNDQVSITLTVNAAAPAPPAAPPSSSSSSGGGGGRIEWPVAFLLGLMLIRRHRMQVR